MENKATILIVDDNNIMRENLNAILIPLKLNVHFATNGKEALAKVLELTPDLILLDVMMPEMDGYEVCQKLRDDPLLKEIPIIMVTALNDRDSKIRGIEAGADEFISKPIDRLELRTRVKSITKLNRYRKLLSERERFGWIIDHADDGYIIVDDADNIRYANPKARELSGLSLDTSEPIEMTFMQMVLHRFCCEPEQNWADWSENSVQKEEFPRYLVRPESPTSKLFWLNVTVYQLPSDLEKSRVIRMRNITEEMAEKRDRRIFQSVIGHKLRTPMAPLISGLQFLAESMEDLTPEDITEIIDEALKGAERFQRQIDKVFEYFEPSAIKSPTTSCNVSQLTEILKEITSNLDLRSIDLAITDEVGNVDLLLSAKGIEHILYELIENSKKFHPSNNPKIDIAVSHTKQKDICLQIMDDGVTLSPDQLSNVWTPYYQAEKYFTGETKGMGLGLPMIASIVWGIGGKTRLFNRKDSDGIIVEIILPNSTEFLEDNDQN